MAREKSTDPLRQVRRHERKDRGFSRGMGPLPPIVLAGGGGCSKPKKLVFGGFCLNLTKGLSSRGDGLVDVLDRVNRANESRFELAARQIDAPLHHGPKELGEAGRVTFSSHVVIRDRLRIEEERPHAA